MTVKLTRKEKIALQQKSPVFSPKKIENINIKNRSIQRILGLFIAAVAFLLYANTLNHEFVLDDYGLIKDNVQTKQGIKAIPEIFKTSYRYGMNITDYSLYRPLSKAMFAIEWSIAPDSPALGHWINVLLYAFLCFVLFRVLCKYMNGNLLVPFITTLIFAAHPIHTEIVANIKSRDEIVCLLLSLSALWYFYSYITKNKSWYLFAGIACYFVALFSKESAITFLVVIPLFFYFFTNADKKKYTNTLIGMVICTGIFLLIRRSVLGNVQVEVPAEDNSIAAIKGFFLQRVNAIYIMGYYLKLLVYPAPLASDGSYNSFPEIGLASWKFLVSFAVYAAAAVYAFMRFKKKDIVSFGIIYFFVTASIVSNVIILIGTNYGERLMFIPSLGFCIIIAFLISKIFKSISSENNYPDALSFLKTSIKPVALVMAIVVLFSFQVIGRNMEWKDNISLYNADIKKVPNSAHMLFYLANHISTEDYLAALPDSLTRNNSRYKAIEYLTKAVTIFPKYADGYQRRGFIYNQLHREDLAEADYKQALFYNPSHPIVFNNYGTLCFNQRRYNDAMENFKQAIRYNPRYAHALNNLASIYGVYGQGELEAITTDPANSATHTRQARENFETAVTYFKKSINVDREFAEPYRLLAVTYRNLNDNAQAEQYDKLYKAVLAENNVKN